KGDKSPCTYPFNTLQDFNSDRQQNIQCQKSYQMVNVRGLIADFPDYSQQREKDQDRASGIERPDRVDSSSFQPTINIHNNMTQDSPKNQFNAPVSGVVANEKAEVTNSTFIQTNNANTAELLKLISSMRETAAQFPEDIREGVMIDIEDVEIEVNKPEDQWSKARLKKSLTALVALAGILGTGVGGAIDIANNAIDLGEKVGIEIQLPSAR
ncbi:MAG: hypothetical protein LH628_07640, partial [Microcoleus sp. CAN_BIN18]|nr:hypothetical protein [Microcoleus sp. CAN_BIN18]